MIAKFLMLSRVDIYDLSFAPIFSSTELTILFEISVKSFSFNVLWSDCIVTFKAIDFFPGGMFSPSYTSKILTSFIKELSISEITSVKFCALICLSTTNAKSLSDL